jgi:hypothetical protein
MSMAEQDTGTAQAAAQTDDTSGQAATGGDAGTQDQVDKGKPFTPDQEQYLGSWMGRIIAKQLDEKVMPHIRQQQPVQPIGQTDDAMKKFQEQVQEKIFGGDSVGAIDMVLTLKEKAKQNLTQTQNMNLMRGITTYSDQPYYEDIQPTMQKLAKEKIAENWPVEAALRASYAEAKAAFLEEKMKGGDREGGGFSLAGGGRSAQRTKVVKLPPEFERAMARDIADGIYKNKEDWVKGMNPKVKERLGL